MSASRDKGNRGEREVARLFAAAGLDEATRVPLSGAAPDYPGDVHLDGYLVEVKRTERLQLWAALRQAEEAAAKHLLDPIVVCRRNRSRWYVVQDAEQWAQRESALRDLRRMIACSYCGGTEAVWDRSVCACGAMHHYCADCGSALDCPFDEERVS